MEQRVQRDLNKFFVDHLVFVSELNKFSRKLSSYNKNLVIEA